MSDILIKTSKRYNFNPKIWGPHAWFYYDTIVLSYPDNPSQDDRETYRNYFQNVFKTLPCQKCQLNYQSHLSELPLTDNILNSRDNLVSWWVKVHSSVRKMTGGKELTEEEFLKYYADQYAHKNKDDTNMTRVLVILCMLALFYFLAKDFIMSKR